MLVLANAGIAVIGTLIGALGVQTRARDLIIPLMALPLLVPVVIGGRAGHRAAVRGRWRGGAPGAVAGGAGPL